MGKKAQTIGYWYKLAMHFGWCKGPIDALLEIRGGDRTAWQGRVTTSSQIYINKLNLYGGEKQEGGIQGFFDVMMGEPTQMPNAYLAATFGPQQSGYRGKATGVFRGGKIGAINPYPKPLSFKLERILKGWDNDTCWYPEKAPVLIGETRAPIIGPWPWVNRETGYFTIGATQETSGSYEPYQGWFKGNIDSIRVTKNVCRYPVVEYAVPTTDFPGSGGDSHYDNVVLLLRMEGADGSAAFTDDKGHTIEAFGGASITTARSRFGGSSAAFDGIGTWLKATVGADEDLGDSWTIEAWVYQTDQNTSNYGAGIFGYGPLNQSGNETVFYINGHRLVFGQLEVSGLSSPGLSPDTGAPLLAGVWNFVSVSRNGATNSFYLHANGKLLTKKTDGLRGMNAAHMLYDSITSRPESGGQGEPTGLINDASFRAAADILFDEGFGLCTTWEGDETAEEFQQRILDTIGACLSQSRVDGQYYLDLIRSDYDFDTLPIITETDVLDFVNEPTNISEAVNQVIVEWFDQDTKENRATAPTISLGAVQAAGGVISETVTRREIPAEVLALRVAARELMAKATPLSRFTLTTNRRPYKLRPGLFFRLQMPSEGIADMVCLAGEIDYGQLTDGKMKVVAMQDVFGMPSTIFVNPEPGLDTGHDPTALASAHQRVFEAPYMELAARLRTADLLVLAPESGYLATIATRPDGTGLNYTIFSAADGEGYVDRGTGDWCPSASIVEAAAPGDTAFTFTGGSDIDEVALNSAALWGEEIVRIDTIDEGAGTVTLARGCADTVPVQHAAGDRIYFYGDDAGTDAREYVDGELVHAKLLTRTSTEVLDAGSAPDDTVVMNGRQARPYPPGNFQIGGVAYPLTESGALAMTWSHRDRVLQADTLIDTLAADIGPEAGTTYTVRIYADGVLEHTETGITGNSFSYTGLSDGVLMRIELFAVRDTLESWQTHIREFLYITTAIDFRITTASDIRITTTSNVRRT